MNIHCRYIFSSRPRQKLRNVFQSKDYVGSQDIALSHTATDSSHMQFVGTAASYMVFDQNNTGLSRTTLPSNGYQFAKPVTDDHKKIDDDDQYALSEEAVYDHSGSNRHKEFKDNIYNHAVDTVYDSGSHKRQNEKGGDTYDHFTGHKTEDDYDISITN